MRINPQDVVSALSGFDLVYLEGIMDIVDDSLKTLSSNDPGIVVDRQTGQITLLFPVNRALTEQERARLIKEYRASGWSDVQVANRLVSEHNEAVKSHALQLGLTDESPLLAFMVQSPSLILKSEPTPAAQE